MLNKVADVIAKSTGFETSVEVILKNGVDRECILVGESDGAKAVLYKEHVEQVIDQHGFYEGCKQLADISKKRFEEDIDGIVKIISEWETAKPYLVNCLRRPILDSGHATRPFFDTEQYCRLEFDNASVVVSKSLLEKWGVSADEMFETACKNQTYHVKGMSEMLLGFECPKEQEVTFVAGGDRPYGAGIICDPDMLKAIRSYIEADYYIIPSSVHEVIVARESLTDDPNDLKDLLRHVNETEVSEEERLSYNLYKYTEEDGLSIVL